jgi:hypothetical protein
MKVAVLTGVLVLLFCQPVLAWGREGHAIIADIAEAKLTPQARAHAAALLASEGASHLSDVSEWADGVKGTPGSPEHGVRLHFDRPPDPKNCRSHFCVVDGIIHYEAVLSDRSASVAQREIALKYVVHLVGDVHQPLHCVISSYSRTPVVFDGKLQGLHGVWDRGIIKDHGGSADQIARELLNSKLAVSVSGTPLDWAVESRDVAHYEIFKDVSAGSATPVVLPADYSARTWPIVSRRLLQAGDRLAILLNKALAR